MPARHTLTTLTICLLPLCISFADYCHADLSVRGIDNDLANAIVEQSPLNGAACDAPPWWIENQLTKTLSYAKQLLETQGYYLPRITMNSNIDQATEAECWEASINIELGIQAQFDAILLEGHEPLQLASSTLEELLPNKGDGFSHSRYENIKSTLIDHAHAKGYLDASWQASVVTVTLPNLSTTINSPPKAQVELQLDLGELFYVGNIQQNIAELEPSFLEKFYDLRPGVELTRHALNDTYQSLMASGYLGELSVTPAYDKALDQRVPVIINGKPARKRSYEVGAGYATDSGPRARSEVRWRRINSRGDRARLTAMAAARESELSAEYRRPDEHDPRHRWLSFGASYEFDEPDTYKREKTAMTTTQTLSKTNGWLQSNVLQYSSETWRIANTDGDTQLLSIGQGWQHSQGEGRGRIAAGQSLNASWRSAAKSLGSDIDMLQLQASYKTIRSINSRWRVLGRIHAGTNIAKNLDILPPDLRFFAGGDNSVRGYDLDTLGEITNIDGLPVVIGGKHIIDASIELDRAVTKDWSAALFIDAGSAFNDTPNWAKGAGLGARWYSPLGPIRIDIAKGFNGLTPGWRLHISFGAEL